MQIRALTSADLSAYRALHRFALAQAPDAFVHTPAIDAAQPDADVVAMLDRGEGWGAFRDGELVAKLTIDALPYPAFTHVKWLHTVYVHPSARGTGAGQKLIEAAMAHARKEGVFRFLLWVNAENAFARRLYERVGFREIGRVPQGIAVNGRFVDDVIMCHALDPTPATPRLDDPRSAT